MQRNSATYCDEPEDAEAFSAFLAEYDEEARTTQAEGIMSSNPFMAELHSRLVPLVITDDTFWQRYFFRCGTCMCSECMHVFIVYVLLFLPLCRILTNCPLRRSTIVNVCMHLKRCEKLFVRQRCSCHLHL